MKRWRETMDDLYPYENLVLKNIKHEIGLLDENDLNFDSMPQLTKNVSVEPAALAFGINGDTRSFKYVIERLTRKQSSKAQKPKVNYLETNSFIPNETTQNDPYRSMLPAGLPVLQPLQRPSLDDYRRNMNLYTRDNLASPDNYTGYIHQLNAPIMNRCSLPANKSNGSLHGNVSRTSSAHAVQRKPEVRKATVKASESDGLWDMLETEIRKRYHHAFLKKIQYTDRENDNIVVYENRGLVDAVFKENMTKFCLYYKVYEVTFVTRKVFNKRNLERVDEISDLLGIRKCYPLPKDYFPSNSCSVWNIFTNSLRNISLNAHMKYVTYTDHHGNMITAANSDELDTAVFADDISKFCIYYTEKNALEVISIL